MVAIGNFIFDPIVLRVILFVLGVTLSINCVVNMLKKRGSSMVSIGVLSTIFGVVLILRAIFPEVFAYFIPDEPLSRIRLIVAVLSVYMVLLTFESIRLTQLKEKYALLWLAPCVILITLTCCPSLLIQIRDRFGMEFSSQMVGVMFIALLFAMYVISITLSSCEAKLSAIAQRCATLEQRIECLEKRFATIDSKTEPSKLEESVKNKV